VAIQFLHPSALWLGLLAILPILLYLFRRKSRTVDVSTLIFFKEIAREHQESAWLRKLKRLVSLLLTLALLALAVLALGRLLFAPTAGEAKGVVLLVDRSASMAAVDSSGGQDRLDRARDLLRMKLSLVPTGVPIALVAYDTRPEVLVPRTTNRREIDRALEALEVRPVPDDPQAALALARRIAELEGPAEIWWASDQIPMPEEGDEVVAGVRQFPVGGGESVANFGITGFQIRPVPLEPGRFEAFIEVSASEGLKEATEISLDVEVGGVLAGVPRIDLEPGGQTGFYQRVEGARGQMMQISIQAETDVLALDNRAVARLPEARPLVVNWFSADKAKRDPFLQLGLQAIAEEGQIEIWSGGAENWPPEIPGDVYLFDGWLPDQWPTEGAAIVIDPPASLGPVTSRRLSAGLPREDIRVADAGHPVLYRISSSRIAVTQTCVLDTYGSLQPLWFAGDTPLLAAGESEGQRLVLLGFSPRQSAQLPLMADFPLLLGNALFWCAEATDSYRESPTLATGSYLDTGDDGGELRWEDLRPEKGGLIPGGASSGGAAIELDRQGLWTRADGSSGGSLLLSRHETSLSGMAAIDGESGAKLSEPTGVRRFLQGELTPWVLGLVVLLLLTESWLFHRHSVH